VVTDTKIIKNGGRIVNGGYDRNSGGVQLEKRLSLVYQIPETKLMINTRTVARSVKQESLPGYGYNIGRGYS
jgi:hypothetical protein